ncbi:solute carrier family 35 member C2-like [Symsagittifera roscoffensis]|uniref:solute carrier family 35 member C2-like n=1 Tax=Symsagittifera roscoffensis TaxID=84072 RepID=UPI00307B1E7B
MSFTVYIIKVIFLGSFFFTCSITLTFYNKWLFQNFHFPLTVTFIHFLTQFLGAAIIRTLMSCCCSKSPPIVLNWTMYMKRVYPAGLAAALDIGLSNMSLMFITVSLYVMSKTSCVVFVLIFAVILRLESPRVTTLIVVLLVSGGLFLFTYKSTQFNLGGFILVISASFLGGLRWVLLQMITQREDIGLKNPIDTTYHMAPVMALGLLLPVFLIEGVPASLSSEIFRYESYLTLETTTGKVALGALLAFLLTLSEYMFVHYTSSLTLSIGGIFKELLTMYLASEINHDKWSTMNLVGAGLCVLGILSHVMFKAIYAKNKYDVQGASPRNPRIRSSSEGMGALLKRDRKTKPSWEAIELLNGDDSDAIISSSGEEETIFPSEEMTRKSNGRYDTD